MNSNELVIQQFYTNFSKKDYKGMQACYHDKAEFSDAVFQNLNSAQVKSMWHMLCKNGKDLQLEFKNIEANEHKGSADWIAHYTFSTTGKKVINRIHAEFLFEDGKIIGHIDSFNWYQWASQAFGLSGRLLGWTSFFRNKVRKKAMGNLMLFMKNNP